MRYLWSRSCLPMVQKCHRVPFGEGVGVYRERFPDGSYRVNFTGLCRCKSGWSCPLCAPQIRRLRAELLAADLVAAVRAGRGLVFLTLTLPHDQGTDLEELFSAVTKGWADVRADRKVRAFCGEWGVDFARSTEVTWGANGFHPHLHVALVLGRPLTREQVQQFRRLVFAPWQRSVQRSGFRAPSFKYGAHAINVLRGAAGAEAVARYMEKINSLSQELTRMDRKDRGKTIGPFTILRRAAEGDVQMQAVWREYELGTKGRRTITFSQTWGERVAVAPEVSDEELAEPDVSGAEWLGMLSNDEALALARIDRGHEVFLDLLGDESPECFLKAVEWLALAAEAELPGSTFRGRLLSAGGLRELLGLDPEVGEIEDGPEQLALGPGDDGGAF